MLASTMSLPELRSRDDDNDDNNLDNAVSMHFTEDSGDDDDDMLFFVILLQSLSNRMDWLISRLKLKLQEHIRHEALLNRQLPKAKTRTSWAEFNQLVSDEHFRRMFRMPRDVFASLCERLCKKVGERVFRPESFLMEGGMAHKKMAAAQQHTGGCMPGEVKAAVLIRILTGGSYLDLVPLFGLVQSYIYKVFDQFVVWVIATFEFPLVKMLRQQQWNVLHEFAQQFSEKSGGAFYGTFGSLDGIAVRITCPRRKEVPDPGNYYCRKGFYALNVQAICHKNKRFLWCNPMNKGSSHDSSAFGGTKLIELLKELSTQLRKEGLFMVGDSACPVYSFLQVPYDQKEVLDDPIGAKDAYNCFLSADRIWIECAFGEFVMRWGLFWRALRFDSVGKCGRVIYAAMLLHNFIVESRMSSNRPDEDEAHFRNFSTESRSAAQLRLTAITNEAPRALVTDNNEPRPTGRPSTCEKALMEHGKSLQNALMLSLAKGNLKRPMESGMKHNDEGHIYMTY